MALPKIASALVAFRPVPDEDWRDRAWGFVRDRFERLAPWVEVLVEGDDSPVFNKCAAVNRAAQRATTDYLLVTDADTWTDPGDVLRVIGRLEAGELAWCQPWRSKLKLNQLATEWLLDLGPRWNGRLTSQLKTRPERNLGHGYAPPLVVSRHGFETVNGLDERMGSYGMEDSAFGIALDVLWGKHRQVGETCVHLWHPRHHAVDGKEVWHGQEAGHVNVELYRRYTAARQPDAMRELVWEEGHRTW